MPNQNDIPSQIASGLIELRKSRRITQHKMAAVLDTRQEVISRFENGGAVPTWRFLSRIARVLHASVEITIKPLGADLVLPIGNDVKSKEFICVNCLYLWRSQLDRTLIQCPHCHKRQGVLYSEYQEVLNSARKIKLQIGKAPPFRKPPPVKDIGKNLPKLLQIVLDSAGKTFPSPTLPVSLLYRIVEQIFRDNEEHP